MRNASGLTAADLAYAQGFQECAEVLSNAQNFQQNMTQSHNGVFLNGMTQNGSHSCPTLQGRSFLNGIPNRKRSFDGMEANPVKKARPNVLGMQAEWLNGIVPLGGAGGEAQMENVDMELAATVTSVVDERHCETVSSNDRSQPLIPFGCSPVTETLPGQRVDGDSPECNNTAGSQVEHQKSVKAEQLYDHAFYSTMLLYHGS